MGRERGAGQVANWGRSHCCECGTVSPLLPVITRATLQTNYHIHSELMTAFLFRKQ